MKFSQFMASSYGRALRVIAGLGLILIGMSAKSAGTVWIIVGAVPLLAGVFDVCILAPLFKMPFVGKKIRATKAA